MRNEERDLILQIKNILDSSPRNDWTAQLVLLKHEANIQRAFEYDPGRAPKAPSLARIRGFLKTLATLGDIAVTINREGSRRFHTYERVIHKPIIQIRYTKERGRWSLGTLLFVGSITYYMGYMT